MGLKKHIFLPTPLQLILFTFTKELISEDRVWEEIENTGKKAGRQLNCRYKNAHIFFSIVFFLVDVFYFIFFPPSLNGLPFFFLG